MAEVGPTMRRKQLGRQLRALREAAGLRAEDAAAALDCVRSRISHIETGRYGVRKPDLEVLLRLYGALDRLETLEEMRREGSKPGWWSTYRLPEWLQAYIGVEDDAVAVRTFSLEAIPGLLQTEAYARAVHIDPLPSAQVGRRVAARAQRQARLTAPEPLALSAVLSEAALSRTLAMGGVGIGALRHIIAIAQQQPNISVRVLPFSAGAHRSMLGSFTLLSFDPEVSPPIAYQEYAVGAHLVDHQGDVQELSDLYGQLRDQALGCDESLELISELTRRAQDEETSHG
ncbi:MAG: helix-turn-helix domain-containing protein [Pseudonocardiaceae bacterium]